MAGPGIGLALVWHRSGIGLPLGLRGSYVGLTWGEDAAAATPKAGPPDLIRGCHTPATPLFLSFTPMQEMGIGPADRDTTPSNNPALVGSSGTLLAAQGALGAVGGSVGGSVGGLGALENTGRYVHALIHS